MRKSVLSVLPSFIALIPWRFSRKTRVKTIPSRITIVRAPKYFGIGVVFVRVATAKTIAHCETTAVRRATPTPRCCGGRPDDRAIMSERGREPRSPRVDHWRGKDGAEKQGRMAAR